MNKKLYPCNNCKKEVPVRSKGLCAYCRNLQKGSVVKRYILKQSGKNKAKKEQKRAILQPFYEYHLEKIAKNSYCENCGCRIQGNLLNLAHILPKGYGRNTEVMGELNNCIYLCASLNSGQEIGCHERFDRIQASSAVYLMPCFLKALEKYLLFRNKVMKKNKYVQIFENYLEENNEKE